MWVVVSHTRHDETFVTGPFEDADAANKEAEWHAKELIEALKDENDKPLHHLDAEVKVDKYQMWDGSDHYSIECGGDEYIVEVIEVQAGATQDGPHK